MAEEALRSRAQRISDWAGNAEAQLAVLSCYSFCKAHVAPYGENGKRLDQAATRLASEFGYSLHWRTLSKYVEELMENHTPQEQQENETGRDEEKSAEDRVRELLDKMVREQKAFEAQKIARRAQRGPRQPRAKVVERASHQNLQTHEHVVPIQRPIERGWVVADERDAEATPSQPDQNHEQVSSSVELLSFKRRKHADKMNLKREELELRKRELAFKEKEAERAHELQLRRVEMELRVNKQRHEEFKMLMDIKKRKLELLEKNN